MTLEVPGKFEITIKRDKNSFKATCSMFPEVTGTGKNEAKAIESLADSLAVKMGSVVKSVLNDFLKKDMLKLFKAEARLRENIRKLPPRGAAKNLNGQDKMRERKVVFDMPPIDALLRKANVTMNKTHPAIRGLIMVLGLHAVHKDLSRRLAFDQEHLEFMEDQLFVSMLDKGLFDSLQPTGHRTPFGMVLSIPMSFN